MERETLLKFHDISLDVAAWGIFRTGQSDVVNYSLSFCTTDTDVSCYSIGLNQAARNLGLFKKPEIVLTDSTNSIIPTNYLPISDPETPEDREVLVFFSRALPAHTGSYTLRIRAMVKGLTADLLRQSHDVLSIRPQTSHTIDKEKFVIHLPEKYSGARMVQRSDGEDSQVVGRAMTKMELADFVPPGPRWITLGWIGEEVQPDKPFGPSIQL
jgi:hypothetical protein